MKREFTYLSKDGKTNIHAIEWIPAGEIAGILQICHGMVEYIDRYDDFANYLSEKGYYVVGHDHLGHGQSVLSDDRLGYFAKENGNGCVIGDIHELRLITEKKYPNVPYFMLGHSMGSFLLRQYICQYGTELAGAIVMGTGAQPDMILSAGKAICKVFAKVKGWTYRSEFVNGMAIGSYNKRFASEGSRVAWLSRNEENCAIYEKDPLCNYVFTVNAYYNMFDGMSKMNKQEKAGLIPKDLPILFVAGAEDPVGNFGKSVENLYQSYKKSGICDVELKLYENDRHEILNEVDRDIVYEDILKWIKGKTISR